MLVISEHTYGTLTKQRPHTGNGGHGDNIKQAMKVFVDFHTNDVDSRGWDLQHNLMGNVSLRAI